MDLRFGADVPPAALLDLYAANGWTTYTRDPDALVRAVTGSTWVATIWDDVGLIGLIRVLSDDVSIAYVQDILVSPNVHRRGVGRQLMTAALERFAHVRQKVLLTDDQPQQRAFYAALGFVDTRDLARAPLRAFVRFEGTELS